MRAYSAETAQYFHGRDAEVNEIVCQLHDALLAHHMPDASMLIMIDQLEELFTLTSADECAKFLADLRALRAHPRCIVIFTLRADFYSAFMESPLWEDLHGRISRFDVSPLRDAALRAAIERPANDVGVFLEPELIERLLADAASEPGTLPLMQETLVQLWEQRRLRLLTLAKYQALGDGDRNALAVVLSRRADATVRALTLAQEQIARRILLRLISFGEGRSDTRRQQPRSKLRVAGDNVINFNAVLRRLIADRLLTADNHDDRGDARIDLAHEVMIAAWPTLAGWLQTRRADEQRRRQVEAAAAQWVERGRGVRGLIQPSSPRLKHGEKPRLRLSLEKAPTLRRWLRPAGMRTTSRSTRQKPAHETPWPAAGHPLARKSPREGFRGLRRLFS